MVKKNTPEGMWQPHPKNSGFKNISMIFAGLIADFVSVIGVHLKPESITIEHWGNRIRNTID